MWLSSGGRTAGFHNIQKIRKRKERIRMKVIMEGGKKKGRWKKTVILGLAALLLVRYFRHRGRRSEEKADSHDGQEGTQPAYSFRFISSR